MCARSTVRNSPDAIRAFRFAANLRISSVAHTAPESITDQDSLVYDSLALEILIARKSQRFSGPINGIGGPLSMLLPLSCGSNNSIRLVSEVGGKFAVRSHHFAG
jgi:hypothetical protein